MPITVPVDYQTDSSGLERDLTRDATSAGKRAGKGFSGGFGSGVKKIAGVGAALGLGSILKDSVALEASFSKTMAQVGAATGEATGELSKLAMQLGADTQFSANEASGAMLELAKSGIETADIMGGALSGTLLLASAGSTDLATASTIAANAMNTFGLEGKNMAEIAAALAGGANASSASVESLGQGLAQVGPGAKNAGLSLQETVGVLSAFDAAGIKGSDAGTSLKTMLTRLIPQTEKASDAMADLGLFSKETGSAFINADGSFKSITKVAGLLQDRLAGLTEEQRAQALTTIFGSDATRAATVLLDEGAKGIGKYIAATKDQNAAQELAEANMSGTAGALERLGGAVETAQLALGQALAPTIRDVADFLSDEAVPAITDFIGGMQDGTGPGGEFADTLEDVVVVAKDVGEVMLDVAGVGKDLVGVFSDLPGPVKSTAVQLGIAYLALSKIRGFALPAITSLTSLGAEFRNTETRMDATAKASQRLGAGVRNAAGAGGLLALVGATQQSSKEMGFLEGAIGGALTGFAVSGGNPFGALIGGAGGGLLGVATAGKEAGDGIDYAALAAEEAKQDTRELASSLDDVTAAYTKMTDKIIAEELRSSGNLDRARELGLSYTTAVNAAKGYPAALAKANAAIEAFPSRNLKEDPLTGLIGGSISRKDIETANIFAAAIKGVSTNTQQARRDVLEVAVATGEFSKTLKGVPESKIIDIGTAGTAEKARNEIIAVHREQDLLDEQIKLLLQVAGLPSTLADIRAVDNAADNAAKPRTIKFSAQALGNLQTILSLGFREQGGPVTKGQPYIVGEKRPEVFVPDQNGTILPRVPAAQSGRSVAGADGPAPVHVTFNEYGPRTSRAKVNEIAWAVRFGTNARGYEGAV